MGLQTSLVPRLSKLGGGKAKREPGKDCTHMHSRPCTTPKTVCQETTVSIHLPMFIIVQAAVSNDRFRVERKEAGCNKLVPFV